MVEIQTSVAGVVLHTSRKDETNCNRRPVQQNPDERNLAMETFARCLILWCVFGGMGLASESVQAAPETVQVEMLLPKGEADPPQISCFTKPGLTLDTAQGPRLVAAIWQDGKALWSEDSIRGGPPYFSGTIEKGKIIAFLNWLKSAGHLDNPRINRVYTGPDSSTSNIVVVSGTQVLSMESWHELAELHPNVAATSYGLVPLDGKTRAEMQAGEKDEDYILFRRTWDEVRSQIRDLLPKEGGKEVPSIECEVRRVSLSD
jgi:hypothetical protein